MITITSFSATNTSTGIDTLFLLYSGYSYFSHSYSNA